MPKRIKKENKIVKFNGFDSDFSDIENFNGYFMAQQMKSIVKHEKKLILKPLNLNQSLNYSFNILKRKLRSHASNSLLIKFTQNVKQENKNKPKTINNPFKNYKCRGKELKSLISLPNIVEKRAEKTLWKKMKEEDKAIKMALGKIKRKN